MRGSGPRDGGSNPPGAIFSSLKMDLESRISKEVQEKDLIRIVVFGTTYETRKIDNTHLEVYLDSRKRRILLKEEEFNDFAKIYAFYKNDPSIATTTMLAQTAIFFGLLSYISIRMQDPKVFIVLLPYSMALFLFLYEKLKTSKAKKRFKQKYEPRIESLTKEYEK